MFTFHLIRTLADARALPPGTIGIEITDPEMAQAILDAGGSNLDGQHGVPCGIGSAREVPFSGSAVELALAFAD
ncbi:MAG TPA: hypothetical protein VFB99_17740, partial [Vicinamibacterales bacterium]|nr:hypothetical protein [Vicinamibacterales bacterium]